MGKVKVKNVSRGEFDICLDFVKEGKVVKLKEGMTCILNEEEYDYLSEQCSGVFKNGFLEVVSMDKDVTTEKVESENVMTKEEIEMLLSKTISKFKTEIKKITAENLLSDIYKKCLEEGKDKKFTDVIEEQIKAVGNESKVI